MEKVQFRPLGKVMEMASATGLEITYAFDDLVFSEHSIFIIRFDKEKEDKLYLFFNTDCESEKMKEIKTTLAIEAEKGKVELVDSGKFSLTQKENQEELEIVFLQ